MTNDNPKCVNAGWYQLPDEDIQRCSGCSEPMMNHPKPLPSEPSCDTEDWKEKMADNLIDGIKRVKDKHCKPQPQADKNIANELYSDKRCEEIASNIVHGSAAKVRLVEKYIFAEGMNDYMSELLDRIADALKAERSRAEAAEADELQAIKERDHREEQIDAIYEALGGTQEWSNLCDRGDDALELVASLESQLSEANIQVELLNEQLAAAISERDSAREEIKARIRNDEIERSVIDGLILERDKLKKQAESLVVHADRLSQLKHMHFIEKKCTAVCKWAEEARLALKAFREGAE